MKNMFSRKFRKGSLLGLVLIIGVCLAILGFGMLHLGLGARVNSANSVYIINAYEAADAGIRHALYQMNYNFDNFKNSGSWTEPGSDSGTLENSNATYSYTISTWDGSPPTSTPYSTNYLIESIGNYGGESAKVCAITGVRNSYGFGIIVSDYIELKESSFLDAYYSTELYGVNGNMRLAGLKIGTTYSGPVNKIFLRNYVNVAGDVLVGVGGDPHEIIWDQGSPGATTGPRYAMNEEYEHDPIIVPNCGPNLGNIPASAFTPSVTIGGDPNDTNEPQEYYRTYNNISIPNGGILFIVGDVNLCILGNLDLNNGAQLIVTKEPWSSARIYLYGNLNVGQGANINNATLVPGNFRLFGLGDGDEKWIINNSGNYYGIYDGLLATIDVKQSAIFYGSIAARNFTLAQSSQVHYDLRLAGLHEYDTGFGIDRWWEEAVN